VRTRASAPSKLLLTGEYAVLDGAPAIVAAMDRRARVEIADRPGSGWTLRTDLDPETRTLRTGDDGVVVLDDGRPAARAKPTRALALVLASEGGSDPLPLDVSIDTRALRSADGTKKLGLGSSAAVVVALRQALRRHRSRHGLHVPDEGVEETLRALVALHRELQGGRGSGADVAAALHGGVLRYERTNSTDARTRALVPPEDLAWASVWTGEESSTSSYLEALAQARTANPSGVGAVLSSLASAATRAAEAFERGPAGRVLEAVRRYGSLLADLGVAIGRPVVSAAHAQLAGLAERTGAVYKPSGAGGGDVGVIFARSETVLHAALQAASDAGYVPLPARVDPRGVVLDEEQ
jgi:phosphomevalonate kinase